MRIYLDTETTNLPLLPPVRSTHQDQPHIVQLAAILENDQGEIVEQMVQTVRPNGWIIPADSVRVHGITYEQAMEEGIAEAAVLEEFMEIARKAKTRIAHNEHFDMRIIRIALLRYQTEAEADRWRDGWESICTLELARRSRLFRWHALNDVHRVLFQEDVQNQHKAMADCLACRRIYHELNSRLGALPLPDKPARFTPSEFA